MTGFFACEDGSVFFIHEIRHAVCFIARTACDMRSQEDIFRGIKLAILSRRFFGVGHVEKRQAVRMLFHFIDESFHIHLRGASRIDENGVFLHTGKEVAGDDAAGFGKICDMIGYHMTGFKNFFKRSFDNAHGISSFIGKERVIYENFKIIRTKKLDDARADHAGAEKSDLCAVIARIDIIGVMVRPFCAGTDTAAEKAFIRKNDLRNGHFRNGNTVCAPCGMNGNAKLKERTRKILHRSRSIKYRFEIREIFRDLFFRKGEHTPGGKDIIDLLKFFFSRVKLVHRFDGGEKIQLFCKFFLHFCGIYGIHVPKAACYE